jgi:hypothetical protein
MKTVESFLLLNKMNKQHCDARGSLRLLLQQSVTMGCTACRAVDTRGQQSSWPPPPPPSYLSAESTSTEPFPPPAVHSTRPTPRHGASGDDLLLVCADCLEEIVECGDASRCRVTGKFHS